MLSKTPFSVPFLVESLLKDNSCWKLKVFTYYFLKPKWQLSFIMYWHIASGSKKDLLLRWIKRRLQLSVKNKPAENKAWAQFSWCEWQMPLLRVRVNVRWFTFYFTSIFSKWWDVNLAKYAVCIPGEWLCHLSKLLAKLRGSKLFEKPIDGEWAASWRITALVTNRMNAPPTLPFSFTNALHPEWVISRLSPKQPHLFVLQHLKCKVVHLTTL